MAREMVNSQTANAGGMCPRIIWLAAGEGQTMRQRITSHAVWHNGAVSYDLRQRARDASRAGQANDA
jgi:hypothetical protein